MNASDDSDEELQRSSLTWCNWRPNTGSDIPLVDKTKHQTNKMRTLAKYVQVPRDLKIKNWIPPVNFLDYRNEQCGNKYNCVKDICVTGKVSENHSEVTVIKQSFKFNWANRRSFGDVQRMKDGDVFWDVLDRSLFGSFKLWKNEYGHVCGLAEGEVEGENGSDKSYVLVNSKENIRILLGVSHSNWVCLEDSILSSNAILRFDAFEESVSSKMNNLERLWFCLCKRRHLLPAVCVEAELKGAFKHKKVWKIMSKLVVTTVCDVTEGHII